MIVDSHCHLDFDVLEKQLPEVLQRASEAGLMLMQTICTCMSKFETILQLSKRSPMIFCSVGNHPVFLTNDNFATAAKIIECTLHPKVIGIGETGLDYYHEGFNKELQRKSFVEHIVAAQQSGLPLIIHARAADSDIIAIMREMMSQQKFSAVIHCFASDAWFAEKVLELGLYLSASGIITFKNSKEVQQVFATAPIDRILIETDSPFLAPTPHRGKVNEPAHVALVARFLAQLRGMEYCEIAQLTTQNFFRLFNKVPMTFKN